MPNRHVTRVFLPAVANPIIEILQVEQEPARRAESLQLSGPHGTP
jgi:hypothetical protein